MTQQQFADGIGVKRDTVSNYEIGRNTPTETVLQMICRVYGLRREWFDTGVGEMLKERSRLEQIRDLSKYSTHPEDMPPAFRNITEWDDERIRNWAASIGKSTGEVINRIFERVDIKEQGYNPSLAVLRLSRTYTEARLDAACELALGRGIKSPRYGHLKAILSANQDIIYKEQRQSPPSGAGCVHGIPPRRRLLRERGC